MTELWLAVINRALLDAAMPVPELKPGTSTTRKWEILRATRLRDEAREWLLEPNPDFDLVCEMAGLQPWRVRQYAAALLGVTWWDIGLSDREISNELNRA